MSYRRKHIHPKIKSLGPKKKFWNRPLFWIILGLLAIIVILYFILFYSKFQVKNIEISGNEKIKIEDIKNIVLNNLDKKIITTGIFNISSKSAFIVDTNTISKNILNTFPKIETIKVQKKLPNSITLKVKERQPFAIFCQNAEKCFSIDQNGIIFEQLKDIPQNMIIISKEQTDKDVFTGENVVDKNIIDGISKVENNLKNNFQVDIKEVFVSNPLIFTTSETWQIYFDPNENMDLQIIKMNALLKDEITQETRKKLQYIYLQYQDRAYYK